MLPHTALVICLEGYGGRDAVEGWLGEKWGPVEIRFADSAGAADVRGVVSFAQCPTDSGVHERHVVRSIRRGTSDDLVPARLRAPLTPGLRGLSVYRPGEPRPCVSPLHISMAFTRRLVVVLTWPQPGLKSRN